MNQDERDELLYRLDARTQRVDEAINRIDERSKDNKHDISDLEETVQRNRTLLSGFATGAMGVLIWAADKVLKII